MRNPLFSTFAAAFLLVGISSEPSRADLYWNTDANNNIISAANWSLVPAGPFNSPFVANTDLHFEGPSNTVTGDAVDIGNIFVAANSFTLFVPSGTMGTGGNIRTVNVGAGATLSFGALTSSQLISSAAGTGFIKTGDGTWITGSMGAYPGGFTLNAGSVNASSSFAFGVGGPLALNGGTLNPASSTARDFSARISSITVGGNVQFGDSVNYSGNTGDLTFGGTMSLGAANRVFTLGNSNSIIFSSLITNSGNGGLTFAATPGGTGRFELTGSASTFTGPVSVLGGEVRIASDAALGATANNVVLDGGRLSSGTIALAGTTTGVGSTVSINTGRTITVGNPATTSISPTLTTGTIVINGLITDISGSTGGFTKTGNGTLVLGGTSAFTGVMTIRDGPSSTLLGTTGNSAIVFRTVTALPTSIAITSATRLTAMEFQLGESFQNVATPVAFGTSTFGFVRLQNSASGSSSTSASVVNLAGALTGGNVSSTLQFSSGIAGAAGFIRLSNPNNTFAFAEINLRRGALAITSNAALGAPGTLIRMNTQSQNGILRIDGSNIVVTHPISLDSIGSFSIRGDNDGDGTLEAVNNAEFSGNIMSTGSVTASTNSFLVQGGTTDGINSAGSIRFSGSNSFAVRLNASANTKLIVGSPTALGDISGTTQTSAGSISFDNVGTYALNEPLLISGSGVLANGVGVGALENIAGNNTFNGPVTLGTAGGGYSGATYIGVTAGSMKLGGNIFGEASANLTKVGPGALIFAGSTSFSGTTFVVAGSLVVNADASSSPSENVSPGAELSGTGRIAVLNSSGRIAPGAPGGVTSGTLTAGAVTLTGGTFALKLDSTAAYSELVANGGLTLSNGPALELAFGFGPNLGSTFMIVSNGSGPVTGLFSYNGVLLNQGATFDTGFRAFSISYTGGDGNDVILTTIVPEPAAVGLLVLGGSLRAMRRSRRRRIA